MKLNVMGYEIEIKGKYEFEKQYSMRVTGYFLNEISLALNDAGNWIQTNGESEYSHAVAENYFKASRDIYNYLREEGFYRGDM